MVSFVETTKPITALEAASRKKTSVIGFGQKDEQRENGNYEGD